MEATALVLLMLVAVAAAGPIMSRDLCAVHCTNSDKFNYNPGTTYNYDYRVETTTSMAGASENEAKLTLTASAEIEVLSQCEFALSLRNTRLFHSDENGGNKAADRERQFQDGLENSVVRFGFQDGVIDSVCADDKEEPWSLNIKKGVLSAFQNSMDDWNVDQNVTETDVAGECPTKYQLVSAGYYTTSVRKSKDMMSCMNRDDYKSMYQLVPYRVESEVQTFPVMSTTHECEQEIETKGLLKSTTCTETHIFRPFSYEQSGGATTVHQSLTFRGERSGIRTRQSEIYNRDTLAFDHSANEVNERNARERTQHILRKICETTRYDVRPESPMIFSDLVSAVRSLDDNDLEDLHRLLKTKTICPSNDRTYKFFINALPAAASSASVRMMTTLMVNGDVTGVQAKAWLMSLAFISFPDVEILKEVKRLLDSQRTREDAMLPVSSLINNYCRHRSSCDREYIVGSLVTSMQTGLGRYCDARGDNLEKVLMTLRAIGNAGHVTGAMDDVTKCLTSSRSPLEVKVAAAEAFRRMPCMPETPELWNTFEDTSVDSELRIAAYLSLMRCPDDATLKRAMCCLDNKDDTEVGTFVYSHLKNIQESSNPHKQDLAKAISAYQLERDFDLSALKSSRNFEASMLLNKINTGFTADSNVIWSSEAQLPRSFAANLTIELFGNSINLLDFGGRLEGLEYIIKNAFGPYLPEDKKWGKTTNELEDVKGAIYGRMFGNEMIYQHSSGLKSPMGKMPSSWLDLLIQMSKQHDYAFTQSSQIMDTRMTFPSVAGLPIHLNVNGTATVDLKVNGKVDLRKVASKPRSLDVDGEIRPSGALEITGAMSVDAFVTKTGLRMRNTLHSSTAMKGRVQLERGQQLNIEIDTPEDKIEVFDANSKFFILHNDMEQEQSMIEDNSKEVKMCSSDMMEKVTGMSLCGEVRFPNASMKTVGPYFPLTGPARVNIVLHKKDTHSGYKLFAKRVENKKNSIAQISFNTPGSRVNRAISLDMTMNYPKQEFEATMMSPWKKAEVKGAMVTAKDMHSVSGNLVIDETDTYAMTAEVKSTQSKNTVDFSPMFEFRRPGADNIQLTGVVSMEKPMKSIGADLSLSGVDTMPYTLLGNLANTKKDKSLSLIFSPNNKDKYSFKSLNKITPAGKNGLSVNSQLEASTPTTTLISSTGNVEYKEDKSLKIDTTVEIHKVLTKSSGSVALIKTEKKNGVRYNTDIKVKSSKLSGRLTGQTFIKKAGLIASKMSVNYNIPKVSKNMIIMNTKFNDRSTKAYKKYTMKSNLEVKRNPEYNLGLTVGVDHKKKHSEVDATLKYGPNPKDKTKTMHFNALVKKNIKNPQNAMLNYKMKAEAPEHKIDISMNGKHQHTPKMVDSTVQLDYAKGKNIKAGVFFKDQSSKLKRMNGKMNLAYPGKEYVLTSKLTQASAKQYVHTMSLKDNKGMKHDVSTVYKMPKGNSHSFTSDMKLQGLKPIKVSGLTTLDPKNFEISGNVISGKDKYGMATKGKIAAKSSGAKVDVEVFYPERRIVVNVDGGKEDGKIDGKFQVDWDADKKKKSMISLEGSLNNKISKDNTRIGGNLEFKSPFDNFENLGALLRYTCDNDQHDVSGKLSWGGKAQELSGSLNVKKPFSIYNVQMLMKMKTPLKRMRYTEVEISHKMDSSLVSVFKGTLDEENIDLTVTGENVGRSRGYERDVKANIVLKSTIRNAESVSIRMSHADNSRRFISNWVVVHNGQTYTSDLTMDHMMSGWTIQNNGDVKVSTPARKISTVWQHSSTHNNIKSSITSKWDNERLYIGLTAGHGMGQYRKVDASLTIQSPWQHFHDTVITVDHKNGYGLIVSKAIVKERGRTTASSEMNYRRGSYNADFDIKITSPYNEDMTAKINTEYSRFPYTGSMEIQWAPRQVATLTSSVVARAHDDFDLHVKITTPVHNFRNVVFKASNKHDGGDMLAQASLDYGVRQSFDFESRIQPSLKVMRFKVNTPFEELKSLTTGYRFDGYTQVFSTQADFELQPIVGKIDGSLNFEYRNDFEATLRIDTPFRDYRYLVLSTFSKDKGMLRQSNIKLEYHPQQVFNFDSSYRFDIPFAFDASIQSPYPKYNDLSMSIQHEHSESNIKSHAEVTYQPYKKIEGSIVANWANEIEGNVVVNTPFSSYESNKLSFRHEGDLSSFNTQGGVEIGPHNMNADAALKVGRQTTGHVTIASSLPVMERVSVSFKKRGPLDNMNGYMIMMLNGDKMESTFNHKWMSGELKTSFDLQTPFAGFESVNIRYNNDYNQYTMDFNGEGALVTTIGSFGSGTFKYSKKGPIDDLAVEGEIVQNRESLVDLKFSNSKRGRVIHTELNFDSAVTEDLKLSYDMDGDMNDFTSTSEYTYGRGTIVRTEMKMKRTSRMIDAEGKLVYSLFYSGGNTVSLQLQQVGDINDFTFDVTGKLGRDTASVSGQFKNNKELSASLMVNTPVSGYRQVGGSFKHSGTFDRFNCEATVTVGDRQKYSGKVDFYRYLLQRIETTVEVTTPISGYELSKFEYRHEGQSNSFKCFSTIEYGRSQKIIYDMSMSQQPKPEFRLSLKTPFRYYDDMLVFGSYDLTGPQYDIDGKINAGNGNVFTVKGNMDTSNDVTASLFMSSPFRGFTDLSSSFTHKRSDQKFDTDAHVTYMDGQQISGKVSFYNYKWVRVTASAELNTPFSGFETTKMNIQHEDRPNQVDSFITVNYGRNQKIDSTVKVTFEPEYNVVVTVNTPFSQYRKLKAEGTVDLNGPTYGFSYNGNYGYNTAHSANGKLNFYSWSQLDGSVEVDTPLQGMEFTKVEYSHKMDDTTLEGTTSLTYDSNKVIKGGMKYTFSPNYEVTFDVKTPFAGYESTQVFTSYDYTYKSYNT